MNVKNGILNVPKHGNKHDLIHFVTDGHKAIPNTLNIKSKTNRKRTTLTIRINHNKSIALERSVINYWGLKSVLRCSNLALGSAVVHIRGLFKINVEFCFQMLPGIRIA